MRESDGSSGFQGSGGETPGAYPQGTVWPWFVDPFSSAASADVFQDIAIVPAQQHRRFQALHPGIRRLMLAIMEDAINVILAGPRTEKDYTHKRTLKWLRADDATYIFSYVSICDLLGIEHTSVRRTLLQRAVITPKVSSAALAWEPCPVPGAPEHAVV